MTCRPTLLLPVVLAASCGGGGGPSSPVAVDVPTRLLACRSRTDRPYQFSEIALRDERNLGRARVADRTGIERGARVHADGKRLVFARERDNADPGSRELFLSSLDGSVAELRLTQNLYRDDEPCWTPDGNRVLFTSEREGAAKLFTMAPDGSDVQPFVSVPTTWADGEADVHAATARVVWSRTAGNGHHELWLANGDGSGAAPFTDGGPVLGVGTGDRAPAFASDGQRLVFVRRLTSDRATLCVADVATAAVSVLLTPNGDVGTPRFAPGGDRVYFGLAEPLAGRPTLRLASLPTSGGTPVLLWPDARWQLEGLELLPSLPAAPVAAAPQTLDVTSAELQIAYASSAFGARSQLVDADGDEYDISTATSDGREVAGINVRFDLPVAAAADVLEARIRLIARCSRADGDSKLRTSIYNPLDERFDTAVELPAATTATTMEFRTSSLRHVTAEKQLRVTVIGDLAAGARAHLYVDLVEVVLVVRAP